MKKILLGLTFISIFGYSLSALTLDSASTKIYFVGYKLNNKTKVPGVIQDAKFSFATTNGSIAQIMDKAKADASFTNKSTKDKMRDNNIKRTFEAKLKDPKIHAEVTKITGDDSAGTINAKITFNGVTKEVPLKYTLADGKFKASGTIDMSKDFDLNNSYIALSTDKQIAALHGKKTWTEVEVGIEADIK
ncbi:YceI family protein [Helicobacter sp. 11S03491-1]|uniref:YceI family protein n=1 Tax=Helicobacter sp. 11S03491-1 TaxID=1476196 RepID=UPI000BA6E381|nr:YceI family protein [Helicobacter sp. 11S03491-1]PAF43876.1 hypothetical protein BKH45_01025 [Helicobacter sp. 11S03491-1]